MPVDQPRTVVIHAHGMVAAKSSNVVAQMLSKKLDFSKVRHIQFIPGGRIRVTLSSVEYRNDILNRKTIQIDDVHFLNVTASDSPVTNVYVHYLPVEAGDVGLRLALLPFGTVHEITLQRFAGFKDISTGTRIVRMSLDHHIPFQCNIQGYPCRVWYAGQPLKCTICKGAHKAADCPDRNKCSHQPGHFAKDCKNAWGTTPQAPIPPGPPPPSNAPHPAPPSAPSTSAPDAPAPSPPVSVDSAAPPADAVVHEPPPLMSLVTSPLQSSDCPADIVEDPAPSQASLFSSEASIGSFSDDEMTPTPAPTPSPSISSFTDLSDDSQSILHNVAIVSSDPVVVEQISPANCNVTTSKSNGNVSGPKEAHNSNVTIANNGNVRGAPNSNVTGPKEVLNCNVTGPKVAHSSNVTGPKEAYCNVTSPNVAHISNVSPKTASKSISNSMGAKSPETTLLKLSQTAVSDSDPSSPEPIFKTLRTPKPRRTTSQSPVGGRSRSPLVSPGSHKGIPQVARDRPSRRS